MGYATPRWNVDATWTILSPAWPAKQAAPIHQSQDLPETRGITVTTGEKCMSANLTELTAVVYLTIFPPDGRIPLKAKANIPAIDSRIMEIEKLATGKVMEGQKRRISDKAASQMLTQQIVQLRDSCSPPMGYREIMRQLGDQITPDAARNRYDDFKHTALMEGRQTILGAIYTTPPEVLQKIEAVAAGTTPATEQPPASEISATTEDGKRKKIEQVVSAAAQPTLLEAKPQQSEEATTRKTRIVQESEEVKPDDAAMRNVANLSPSQAAHIRGPMIPHSEDEHIRTERNAGKKFSEIQEGLQAKGIACHVGDVSARYYGLKKKHGAKVPAATKSELSDMDLTILGMHERECMISEIAIAVGRKFGRSLSTHQISKRIQELQTYEEVA